VRLILASASPRRAELLRAAGFSFDVVVANVDERVRDGEAPWEYVRRLATEKSAAALAALKGRPTTDKDDSGIGQMKGRPTIDKDDSGVGRPFRAADAIILAADTSVVVDGAILGKPRDDAEAAEMLTRLSGRWHEVLTGVSLRSDAVELNDVETTRVLFASLSPADVSWYVGSGEGRDKAGAYAIQGLGSRFIPRIEGSYTNVVGLPAARVVSLLRQFGSAIA